MDEAQVREDDESAVAARPALSPLIKLLAVAEFVVGIGALVVMGETNPLYYLLIVVVALVVIGVVASDQRRRTRVDSATGRRTATPFTADVARSMLPEPPAAEEAPAHPATAPTAGAAVDGPAARPRPVAPPVAPPTPPRPVALRSEGEEFVAALIEYGMRVGVRAITRTDREGWAAAQHVEYELLRAASCCAENERGVVGELVTWDSVSVLHLLDRRLDDGDGIARSVVAPYGRLPAATRVPVRRDPARVTCEVATLALDPRVANEYALNLLWRGIYDHARRGGAGDVVWTLAVELAALWRERFGFPVQVLGEGRRAPSGTAVTVVISLGELESKLLRERPAYYGWLTSGFSDIDRAALGMGVDLSGAYERVCAHVMAKLDSLRSPLALR